MGVRTTDEKQPLAAGHRLNVGAHFVYDRQDVHGRPRNIGLYLDSLVFADHAVAVADSHRANSNSRIATTLGDNASGIDLNSL